MSQNSVGEEVENSGRVFERLEKKFKGLPRTLCQFSGRGQGKNCLSPRATSPDRGTGGQGDRGSSKEEHDLPKGEEMLPAGPARAK